MIGKMMGAKLLGGRTLEFYQWGGADPKEALLPGLRGKIDEMVSHGLLLKGCQKRTR